MECIGNSLGIRSGQPGARGNRLALATVIASYLAAGSFAAAAYFCKGHRLAPLAKKGSLALVGLGSAVGIGRAATRCFAKPEGPRRPNSDEYQPSEEERQALLARLQEEAFAKTQRVVDERLAKATPEELDALFADLTRTCIRIPLEKLTDATRWADAEVVKAMDENIKKRAHECNIVLVRLAKEFNTDQAKGGFLASNQSHRRTLICLLNAYHHARGSATFTPQGNRAGVNPEANAALFYTQGSTQNEWRLAYNRMCGLLAPIIHHITGHEEEFRSAAVPDNSADTYQCPLT